MADFLHSLESQHVSHAPLSHAQNIQLVKWLHGLNQQAMKQLADLRSTVGDSCESINGLKEGLGLANANMESLKNLVGEKSTLLDKVKNQVHLNTELGARLQDSADEAAQGINDLISGLKVTNTNAQSLKEDHGLLSANFQKLRREIDREVKVNLKDLNDLMGVASHRLDSLTHASDQHKRALLDHKNGLLRLDEGASLAAERTSRLEDTVARLHTDLATLVGRHEGVKDNLEMTNAVVMKIHEELEAARADAAALKEDHLALGSRHDTLRQDFTKASKAAAKLTESHEKLLASHGQARKDLDENMKTVVALQEGYVQTHEVIKALSGQVDRISIQLASTQENLQVTNALVLPNVAKGDQVSPQFGGNIGVGGGTPAGKLLRRRKEANWVTRNIGIVPNRTAWT
eukprot:TRINITY_DN51780_c0_g1_i1.p1 TRINITY_DN51780_c0_g1~~TRINITY_DN51780_c0_g1_i1.p1  ORF type:complete len:441 (-),score=101.14 TRINITY_DN51780_c0_g1_i1:60-1271(-)